MDHTNWKKTIALFLISQNISLFGSAVVGFSIIWHITLQTKSGFWMMLATIAFTVPQVSVSLFGGVWADRYNRKTLIMLSDGVIAIFTMGLALAILSGFASLWLLLAVSAVRSFGSGIQTPSVNALYPQITPMDKLARVQGINQSINSVSLLMAPVVGGVILGSLGIFWACMVDVVTASIGIIIMSFIKVKKISTVKKDISILEEMRIGLQYAFKHNELRRLLICFSVVFFLMAPAAVLSPLLVARSFGEEVWRLTANELVWSAAALLGGIFVTIYGNFKNKVRTIAICLICFGITFALMGFAGNFTIYLVFAGMGGFFMPIITTVETVYIQEITDPAVLGRVFSIVQIFSASAMPLGIMIFGPLADIIAVESLLIITGILVVFVGFQYQQANVRK